MINKKVIDLFWEEFVEDWPGGSNSSDCLYNKPIPEDLEYMLKTCKIDSDDYDVFESDYNISDEIKSEIRNSFNIGINEEIIFIRDTSFFNSRNQGLVITDSAIHCIPDNDKPEEEFAILWSDLDRVEYKDAILYFYNYNGDNLASIHISYFMKSDDPAKGRKVGNKLSELFSKVAGEVSDETFDIYNSFLDLESEEKYDEALSVINQLLADPENGNNANLHFFKGRILYKKENTIDDDGDEDRYNEIHKELDKAMELTDDMDLYSICCYWKALTYSLYGQYFLARNQFIDAMKSDSEGIREESKESLDIMEDKLSDTWKNYTTEYKYEDRKFIMPINDYEIAGCYVNGIDTFRMSNIPSCIKFPMGHPVSNELYIGHPYRPELYVPYENSEDIFFVDKIHELCYLLECLGAEEISITSIKGRNVTEIGNFDAGISGNADIGLYSFNGDLSASSSNKRTSNSNIQRTITQKFDPMKKPYVPEGLIWFQEQVKWQRLANSRLNGNLLEYNEYVSSSETKFVSNTERTNIKASAEYLWNQVNVNAEISSKEQFKEATETQWKVEVKFRSRKMFADEPMDTVCSKQIIGYTEKEQEFLDNLKEFLEDDAEITPRERKILNRIREKLGISEERGKELEESLKPKLTEDEQEYLEMYSVYLKSGEISEKERRRLDKFATALGIDDNRKKELENM